MKFGIKYITCKLLEIRTCVVILFLITYKYMPIGCINEFGLLAMNHIPSIS